MRQMHRLAQLRARLVQSLAEQRDIALELENLGNNVVAEKSDVGRIVCDYLHKAASILNVVTAEELNQVARVLAEADTELGKHFAARIFLGGDRHNALREYEDELRGDRRYLS